MKANNVILVILTFLLGFNISQAKDISVSEFFEITEDLTARTSPVLDNNDQACALIKVVIPDKATFEGNVVKSEYKTNEYYIYVTPGTKQLVIKYPGAETLTVKFSNYQNLDTNGGLIGARTYRLKLYGIPEETSQLTAISDYQNFGTFSMKVEPSNAEVLVNGLRQYLDSSGKLEVSLPWGFHSYRVSANKHYSLDGQFMLDKKNSKVEKKVSLKPKFGYLTINCSSEMDGAEVKVDGNILGTLPIVNHPIDKGSHSISISKKLYLPYTQNINIAEGKTFDLKPTFQPNYAEYEVNTGNDNMVKIYIDNEYVGNGSWKGKLEPGSHNIEARKENHKTSTKTVTVIKNNSGKIAFPPLVPEYGTLNIFSDPKEVIVTIDGKRELSSKNIKLKAGNHHVTLSKKDYNTEVFDVTIYTDQVMDISKKLSKKSAYTYSQWMNSHQNKSFFTIYAAYENLQNSALTWDGTKYDISKNNSGVALGLSYDLYANGFVFSPAFEISYDSNRIKTHRKYPIEYFENEHEYNTETEYMLNIRIPLQIGYRFVFSPNYCFQLYTGPIAESLIGATNGNNFSFSNIDRWWDMDSDYYWDEDNYVDKHFSNCIIYKRFSIDWRLGVNFNYKSFLIGMTYNMGLTNRVEGRFKVSGSYNNDFYENITKKPAKQTLNYFQIKFGIIF